MVTTGDVAKRKRPEGERPERLVVDLGGVSLEDSPLLQPSDPLVHRRRRHAEGPAEVRVADPAVLREEVDDATVEVFHPLRVDRPADTGPSGSQRGREPDRGVAAVTVGTRLGRW